MFRLHLAAMIASHVHAGRQGGGPPVDYSLPGLKVTAIANLKPGFLVGFAVGLAVGGACGGVGNRVLGRVLGGVGRRVG